MDLDAQLWMLKKKKGKKKRQMESGNQNHVISSEFNGSHACALGSSVVQGR